MPLLALAKPKTIADTCANSSFVGIVCDKSDCSPTNVDISPAIAAVFNPFYEDKNQYQH